MDNIQMAHGNIIHLNGTSSSGKTAIAKALQEIMEDVYIHTGIDHFIERVPNKIHATCNGKDPSTAEGFLWIFPNEDQVVEEVRLGPAAYRLLFGIYHAVAALAATGNNVIVDDVIFDSIVLREAVNTLYQCNPLFVGVHCPLEIAQERERERGDRTQGLVHAHYGLVHSHREYDLEVDTSTLTPMQCANIIKDRLMNGDPPQAMRRLQQTFAAGTSSQS